MERCLGQMVKEGEDIAWAGIEVWVGGARYSAATARKLVELCLITPDRGSQGGGNSDLYWHITPCGRAIIKDPGYEPAIIEARRTGRPVFRK